MQIKEDKEIIEKLKIQLNEKENNKTPLQENKANKQKNENENSI